MSQRKSKNNLGRLSAFGITEPWQVALLLPIGWDDMRQPLCDFHPIQMSRKTCVIGALSGDMQVKLSPAPPRLTGTLVDQQGQRLRFSAFGDSRELEKKIKAYRSRVTLYGQCDLFKNSLWLKNPECVEPHWAGHMRPRYSGKPRVISPDLVRERVFEHLSNAIPIAADFIAKQLRPIALPDELCRLVGLAGWTMEQILWQAHIPQDQSYGEAAHKALDLFAAMGMILSAQSQPNASHAPPTSIAPWKSVADALPLPLTEEQLVAIDEIIKDIGAPGTMRRILSGDVGTGKTICYLVAARSVIDAGGRVIALFPNETLALQVASETQKYWPGFPLATVTGEGVHGSIDAPFLIGTTALLFQDIAPPDLLIIDEQQKMGVAQREQLIGPGTNLLEVTATCIPRSMALARYGMLKVSMLKHCHCEKQILTRIWRRSQWKKLFKGIQETINNDGQVLLIYPLHEAGENDTQMRSAEEVFAIWDKLLPGQVRCVHGQSKDKEGPVEDLRQGKASVLISTSMCEVGINIPKLRRVIVASPERFGLTTLHQIRGRVARLGGQGYCDLYLPYDIGEKSLQRLTVLTESTDGFYLAEQDLRLRGAGDLSSGGTLQSGADETFLYGRPVSLDALDEAIRLAA